MGSDRKQKSALASAGGVRIVALFINRLYKPKLSLLFSYIEGPFFISKDPFFQIIFLHPKILRKLKQNKRMEPINRFIYNRLCLENAFGITLVDMKQPY